MTLEHVAQLSGDTIDRPALIRASRLNVFFAPTANIQRRKHWARVL